MMVPDGWYPGYDNATSQKMVKEYVAQYGGAASGVNADVAEAYSVGQVMAQAVTATGGTDNAKIISYLHSGVTLNSVQGPVKFDALGENGAAAAFIFQWDKNNFTQVLPAAPAGATRSSPPSRPGAADRRDARPLANRCAKGSSSEPRVAPSRRRSRKIRTRSQYAGYSEHCRTKVTAAHTGAVGDRWSWGA